MKLFSIKNLAMTGALSVAGLGLIGVGAHAVFTSATSSNQTITAGTPDVVMSSPSASDVNCQSVALAVNYPTECQNITLTPPAAVNSTFNTPSAVITLTNIGNIAVSEFSMQLSDVTDGTSAGAWLAYEMNVCIFNPISSTNPSGPTWIIANGPLHVGTALSPSVPLNGPWNTPPGTATVLMPNYAVNGTNSQDNYSVNFYAGTNSTLCGPGNSAGTYTAGLWGGLTPAQEAANTPTWIQSFTPAYATPASLGNEAEGGAVRVTLAMNYVS